MNQKEAVFMAVINVCGTTDGQYTPTREQRAQVNAILFEGVRSGQVECDTEYDAAGLKQYVSGLQSNWLRKDKRLNGGVKYEAKNPGSRAGVADPQLKNMRALLSTLTDPTERSEVEGYIATRVSEVAATKPVKAIDFSALPEALAKFKK